MVEYALEGGKMNQVNKINENESLDQDVTVGQRMVSILTNPQKGMEIAARKPMLLGLLVILIISAMVIYIPQRPMFLTMTMTAIENSQETYSADQIDQLLKGGANAAMFMSMFYFVCTPMFKGLVSFALATLLNGSGKLKATLGVVMNAYVIMLVGQILRMIIVLATGNPYFSLSPAMFLEPGQETGQLFSVLSAIDLFAVWYLAVSMLGIKSVHKLNLPKAFIVSFGPWLLMLALGLVGLG